MPSRIRRSGIVRIERAVETVTSFPAYAASHSYRSANMVDEDAAGAEARIKTTCMTGTSMEGKNACPRRKSSFPSF